MFVHYSSLPSLVLLGLCPSLESLPRLLYRRLYFLENSFHRPLLYSETVVACVKIQTQVLVLSKVMSYVILDSFRGTLESVSTTESAYLFHRFNLIYLNGSYLQPLYYVSNQILSC